MDEPNVIKMVVELSEKDYARIRALFPDSIFAKSTLYVERPKGKWEDITPPNHFTPGGDPLVRCPFCKDRESVHLGGIEGSHWKFCPNCGADLGGDADD